MKGTWLILIFGLGLGLGWWLSARHEREQVPLPIVASSLNSETNKEQPFRFSEPSIASKKKSSEQELHQVQLDPQHHMEEQSSETAASMKVNDGALDMQAHHPQPQAFSAIQKLIELAQNQHWEALIAHHDQNPFPRFENEAREWRAEGVYQLLSSGNLQDQDWRTSIERIDEQLVYTPSHAKLLMLKSSILVKQGLIHEALENTSHALQIVHRNEDRQLIQQTQTNMVHDHVVFLQKEELWPELIAFLRRDPAPNSPLYYHFQLIAAEAHFHLFQWDEAESNLNMAEFNPDLQNQISKLRKSIRQLKAQEQLSKTEAMLGRSPEDSNSTGLEAGTASLPFERRGNAMVVRLGMGGHELKLLLDTGASLTMISKAWMDTLQSEHRQRRPDRIFITAGGKIRAPVIQMKSCRLGPFDIQNVDIAFRDVFALGDELDGLLGMNILKFFKMEIDFTKQKIHLKPRFSQNKTP